MIKLISALQTASHRLHLTFSDGSSGELDFLPLLLAHDTVLTRPLREPVAFGQHYLELGALAWPNGLEFSARSLQIMLSEAGRLQPLAQAA
jgi:hypothetical protein